MADNLHLLLEQFSFALEEIDADALWLRVRMARLDPAQRSGWKLHLSATPSNGAAMLAAALPVLAEAGVPFRIAADLDVIERLNSGELGLTQVGKIATIYPPTEEAAATLAARLRDALRGIAGPGIPTDFAYADDAPIYFRFGPFDNRVEIDAMGQEHRLLWRPDLGRDVRDDSTAHPPVAHLPARAPGDHLAFLRGRFRLLRMLQLTAKGGVFIAVEEGASPPVPLIIKTARPGANSDQQGRDAARALAREHALLAELAGIPGLPPAGELVASAAALATVRPYLHGETFWEVWTSPNARTPAVQARLQDALQEAEATADAIHARGHVVRDISAGNLLLGHDRKYLMDLELAQRIDDPAPPYRRGTRGFYDPDRPRDASARVEDDTFAFDVLREMVDNGTPPALAALAGKDFADSAPVIVRWAIPSDNALASWNMYSGVAGQVWAAQQLGVACPRELADALMDGLERAAARVLHIPGCYFGASGHALAVGIIEGGAGARAAALLSRVDLGASAVPDLCQGVAGYLLAAVELHRHTGDAAFLAHAQAAAERLHALAVEEDGHQVWRWPEGAYGDLSAAACYGFGHGVAGIVHALVALHNVAPSIALAEEIRRGVETLRKVALPVPGLDDACWWPVSKRDDTCWNAWCHGTPGVLKTLAGARGVVAVDDLLGRALRGMYAANNGEVCLCHGVASRVDAFVDATRAGFDTAPHRARAAADATLLGRSLAADSSGRYGQVFDGGTPAQGAGLMTGPLGVGLTLARYDATA